MTIRMLAGLALVMTLAACATARNDSVTHAEKINDGATPRVNERETQFVVDAVDARRMDFSEGKLAAERGTTAEIREYGQLMMKDQTRLLDLLLALAKDKHVTVPAVLGKTKAGVLKDLQAESGESFDKKFIYTITIDHKRDVKEFAEAAKFDDASLRTFATTYQPMIQSHLDGIQQIAGK